MMRCDPPSLHGSTGPINTAQVAAPREAAGPAEAGRGGRLDAGWTSGPVSALVEMFDIEPFSDFSAKWSNFMSLVLLCIDANFARKY